MIRSRLKSGFSILTILLLVLVGAREALAVDIVGKPAPREIKFKPSVLANLAKALAGADDEKRSAFVRIALREMLATYEAELERADEAVPKTNAAKKKLARWRFATRRYLAELRDVSRLIETGDGARIHVDKQQRVLLFIGDYPVIVNGPRIGRKAALEQRIKEEFCLAQECASLMVEERRTPSEPAHALGGTWMLDRNRRPRYETADGLLFEFRNIGNRARKEQACLTVIPELRELAAALKMARETGYAIDWPGLALEALPASEEHRVLLNRRGDFLRLTLPRLQETGGFWREALPWLRARADGKTYRMRFSNAERLLRTASAGRK